MERLDKRVRAHYMLCARDTVYLWKHRHLKSKKVGKRYTSINIVHKNDGVDILTSKRVGCRTQSDTRDKVGHFIMIKKANSLERYNSHHTRTLNTYMKPKLTEIKGELCKLINLCGEFNSLLSVIDRINKQTMNKVIEDAINISNQFDLTKIYRMSFYNPCNSYGEGHFKKCNLFAKKRSNSWTQHTRYACKETYGIKA